MSQYLSAQIDAYLPPFGYNEGQMMPAVRDIMRKNPWKGKAFDWDFIRAQWETLVSGQIFLEASPPNLLRVSQIEPVFGCDSSAVISICNPYQHIASLMRRYSMTLTCAAESWIMKAGAIREINEDYPHFPFISYEEFVKNPSVINEKLQIPYKDVKVEGKKGSDIDGISSAYCRSVGFFQPEDITAVTKILERAPDLLEYFGYKLVGPEHLNEIRENDDNEFRVGLERRKVWERRQNKKGSTFE